MSSRKKHKDNDTIKIGITKKQLGVIFVGILFLGSTLGFGVHLGTQNSGSGSSHGLQGVHWHADYTIFINGQQIQPSGNNYFQAHQIIHAHSPHASLIHAHATPIPINTFFQSFGAGITNECLTLDKERYCNDGTNTLKFIVNGQSNHQFGNYVFNDQDKILISYGPLNEDVSSQYATITSLAADASAGRISG